MRRTVLACAAIVIATSMIASAPPAVRETRVASTLTWQPMAAFTSARLTVDGPDGFSFSKTFPASSSLTFSPRDAAPAGLADGQYTYELILGPPVDAAMMSGIRRAEEQGDSALLDRLKTGGRIPRETAVYAGSFVILNGAMVSRDLVEPAQTPEHRAATNAKPSPFHPDDNVVADDEIVQGSICVGLDCVNNESFGFDTIRLKENNTRIHFFDTSVGAFPSNDWQLTANDSNAGGLNRFSIDDVDNNTSPLNILAAAPSNSIFIASTGKVGFRTSTPVLDLHILTGDTPGIRLDQSNASGFTPQTWDIAGNEANFFVRDVTGGSRLPFRIRPGATTSSVDIAAGGLVGINTASPAYTLDVNGDLRVVGNLIANVPSPLKSGIVTAGQFSGNPPTASVTFAVAFPDTGYIIGLTPVSNNGKLVFNVQSKTATGFTISSDKPVSGLQELDWIATKVTP